MIRKLALAVAAIAALGTASLAVTTTPASAKGFKGGHHHGHHGHFRGGFRVFAGSYGYYDGCLKRVWVLNRYGETVLRTINTCDE